MPIPKRKVIELLAINRFEGQESGIFVEGSTDKKALRLFLEAHKLDAAVYEIGAFEVDPRSVLTLGLEDNNRGRIITLARATEPGNQSQFFIADKDFDEALGITHRYKDLLFTDYSCIEMYGFEEEVVRTVLVAFINDLKRPIQAIMNEFGPILKILFIVRLINHTSRLGLKSVAWQKSCALNRGELEFDLDDYLSRYLGANKKLKQKSEIVEQIRLWQSRLDGDIRNYINGHDFVGLMNWYVGQVSKVKVAEIVMASALLCAIRWGGTLTYQMFADLNAALR